MPSKSNWNDLNHEQKLAVLRDNKIDQIIADYEADGLEVGQFRELVSREMSLWQPHLYKGKPVVAGEPPNKEVVLGAWRDLERSEAILELIDNSIDAWMSRRRIYPDKTAKELNIYIDIDSDTGQLSYLDNAGGVQEEKLVNLVVPGHSDTDALIHSIGSYKTGGKKAIFRLATAVNITTRYWNPAETGDQALSVHLDPRWLKDPSEYRFPYFVLQDKSSIERGQTRYVMQLRPEPIGNYWYGNPAERTNIEHEIQRTYSLLMARNGTINIYFPQRGKKIAPALEKFYDFSGTHDGTVDIRPQAVKFNTKLEYEGKLHDVAIEVVIGCRVTTASRDEKGPGFDLYGNNRLFVYRDQRLFADALPKGNVSGYIRGFVNILGPNVFIPWDTHKRHLNTDREVIDIIRNHPVIKDLFENWKDAFSHIADLGKGEITKTVSLSYPLQVDKKNKDIKLPYVSEVDIDPARKRGEKLPSSVHRPKVKVTAKKKQNKGVQIKFILTTDQARRLAAHFAVKGLIDAPQTKQALSEKSKEYLLKASSKS